MKLLLTSGGLRNQALIDSLIRLAEKPFEQLKLAFIPTASDVDNEDKTWLIDDLIRLKELGLAWLDIVDIAALPTETIIERLDQVDVIFVEGGDTQHLMEQLQKKELHENFRTWADNKVYIGVSAGSIMASKVINPAGMKGLGWVDFLVMPHMNASFSKRTEQDVEPIAKALGMKVYWLDDNSAVEVNGDNVQVVGSGEWKEYS